MKNVNKKNVLIWFLIVMVMISSAYILFKGSYAVESSGGTGTDVNGKLVLNCSNNGVISPSGTLSCTLKGSNFTTEVSSIRANLNLSSNLTLQNISFNSNLWFGDVQNGKIALVTADNKTGNFDIMEFTLKASNINTGVDTGILLKDIMIGDKDFEEHALTNASLNVRITSNVSTLNSLTVSGSDFTFNANTTSYNLTIDAEQVTINAVASNNFANITGTGTKNLNYGDNTFEVVVTAEDGSTTKYTLLINRPDKLVFDEDVIIDGKYLTFVMKDTSVVDMLAKIDTSGTVLVTDANGETVSENTLVGTGFNIKIIMTEEEYNYDVVVLGDTNGDGKVSITDVSQIFQVFYDVTSMDDIYMKAGDVKADGEIQLTDVSKLLQYVSKAISSLR